ncbi:hypothetical protein EON65_16415 [archaeon]|nr:MAG: hypothetical protein EON65_16415 [archaeon]
MIHSHLYLFLFVPQEIRLLKETVQNNLFRWETERAQLRKELGKIELITFLLNYMLLKSLLMVCTVIDDGRMQENQAKQDQQTLTSQMHALKQIIQEKNQMIEVLSTRRQSTGIPAPDVMSRPSFSSTSGFLDAGVKTPGGYINYSNYNVYPTLAATKHRTRPNVDVTFEPHDRTSYEELPRHHQPRQQELSEHPTEAYVSPYKHGGTGRYLEGPRSRPLDTHSSLTRQPSESDSPHLGNTQSSMNRNTDHIRPPSGSPYIATTADRSSSSHSAPAAVPSTSNIDTRTPPVTSEEYDNANARDRGTARLQPVLVKTTIEQSVVPSVVAAKVSPEQDATIEHAADSSSVLDTSSYWLVSMNMNAVSAASTVEPTKEKTSPPKIPSGIADSRDQAKEVSRTSSRAQLVFASDSKDSNEGRPAEEKQQIRLREEEKLAQIEADKSQRAEQDRLRRIRENEEAERERLRQQREAADAEQRRIQEQEDKDRQGEREAEMRRRENIDVAERKRRYAELEEERRRNEAEREEERKQRESIEDDARRKREEEEEKQRKIRLEEEEERKRVEAEDEIAAARAKVLARRKQKQSIESMVSQSDEKPATVSSFNSRGSFDFKLAEEKPSSTSQNSSLPAKATLNFGSSLGDDVSAA